MKTGIVSVYAPNDASDRLLFFKTLIKILDTPGKVILGGDFNCVLSNRDRSNHATTSDSSATKLKSVLEQFDLVDVTSPLKDFSPRFTHWQGTSHARLDRFYFSSEMLAQVEEYMAEAVSFSDHALVSFSLKPGARTRSKARDESWKMNMSILQDEEFASIVKEKIEVLSNETPLDACVWENSKMELKELATDFSQKWQLERTREKRALVQSLRTLIVEEEQSPGVFLKDIKECKTQLLKLLEEKLYGAAVRSRTRMLNEKEVPTKIFVTLERTRGERNTILKVRKGDAIAEGQAKVEEMFAAVYTLKHACASTYPQNTQRANLCDLWNQLSECGGGTSV